MIHEVDEALRELVKQEGLRGSPVDVIFDAPTKDWAARRNAPTVNLYLYDLREDLKRRTNGKVTEYGRDGQALFRHRAVRFFRLSYLLSAWTQRVEDEHRLLSELLVNLLHHVTVPRRLLSGQAAELGLDVLLTIALPPAEDRSFADVWSALGGELKPSLDIVVTAPVLLGPRSPIPAAAGEGLSLDLSSTREPA
jgi:hypothetical protein